MNDRLGEIEARLKAASPGPWGEREEEDYYQGGTYITSPVPGYAGNDVCRVDGDADKDFIKAAREDVPWLVEEVRRLRAEVAELLREYMELRHELEVERALALEMARGYGMLPQQGRG